jgi:hypothetical protein
MGALVQSLEMNEVETTINISTLSSGVYIIRLTNGESSSTQRFVKE